MGRKIPKQPEPSGFKPYTLRDYKVKMSEKKKKLGGLGANKDEKWQHALSQLAKMKYFGAVMKGNGLQIIF